MNELLQEKLESMLSAIEQGAGFIYEQAPLVVQEMLAWGFWSNVILSIAFALSSVAAFCLSRSVFLRRKRAGCPDFSFYTEGVVISSAIGCVLLIPMFISALHAIKILIAPRLFLIEEFSRMLS